jgi:transcriptional regulator with XRE-family HTH domain
MDERRQALGMTWAEVASDAKITVETLRAVRRGNNQPSALTKRGLERALQWQSGSIDQLLKGGDPIPSGGIPPLRAEMVGVVEADEGEGDEEDSPISPQLRALLKATQQRTEERLAELSQQVAKQNELIERLLEDRKGA